MLFDPCALWNQKSAQDVLAAVSCIAIVTRSCPRPTPKLTVLEMAVTVHLSRCELLAACAAVDLHVVTTRVVAASEEGVFVNVRVRVGVDELLRPLACAFECKDGSCRAIAPR